MTLLSSGRKYLGEREGQGPSHGSDGPRPSDTRAALDRLFAPESVAVVGGGAWGRSVIRSLDAMGYQGPVWPVHPNAETVAGKPAFASVDALPAAPDACFIGVNRHATIDVLKALSSQGAGGAVCFASGFAESGDGALNEALLSAAGDMAIIGPNCYGFVNAMDGAALWPDVHGLAPVSSGVAILTQSSNIALNISMQRRGLPIGFLGTAGNQAQTGLAEMATRLIEDARITALGLHIEGVGDVGALQRLARRAHALGKPVVVLKPGVSEAAQQAAVSHTASLAGSDAGAGALFARLGFIRVRSLEAMLEALKHAFLYGPAQPGPIASLSCSGGEASLMADAAELRGLEFAPLSAEQDAQLAELLGPLVTRANPLDYHTFIWGDGPRMGQVYECMASGAAALTAIVVDFPRADRCDTSAWDCVTEAARHARAATGRRIALLSSLPDAMPEETAAMLMEDGILPLSGIEAGLDALAALYGARPDPDPARPIPLPRSGVALLRDEAEAKAALRGAGLDIPRGAEAASPEEAARLSGSLLPVVLKARGLAHKSESGGVVLGLASEEAVLAAAETMNAKAWYVEEMVGDGVAELLVGIVADPAHGYVLSLGAGGVLTELWRDVVQVLVPATEAEIDAALNQLRIAPLIDGYRGRPAGHRAALIDAVMKLQDHVMSRQGAVAEIEINPLILTPARAVVADALIREVE